MRCLHKILLTMNCELWCDLLSSFSEKSCRIGRNLKQYISVTRSVSWNPLISFQGIDTWNMLWFSSPEGEQLIKNFAQKSYCFTDFIMQLLMQFLINLLYLFWNIFFVKKKLWVPGSGEKSKYWKLVDLWLFKPDFDAGRLWYLEILCSFGKCRFHCWNILMASCTIYCNQIVLWFMEFHDFFVFTRAKLIFSTFLSQRMRFLSKQKSSYFLKLRQTWTGIFSKLCINDYFSTRKVCQWVSSTRQEAISHLKRSENFLDWNLSFYPPCHYSKTRCRRLHVGKSLKNLLILYFLNYNFSILQSFNQI